MANRKRKRPGHSRHIADHQTKLDQTASKLPVKQRVLEQYYPQVVTLREYLLSKLPTESKIRRKKLTSAGQSTAGSDGDSLSSEIESLKFLLDTTLVGKLDPTRDAEQDDRNNKWLEHAASCETSDVTFQGGTADLSHFQGEIVDFVIWLIFAQSGRTGTWPKHILSQGYRRGPLFTPQRSKMAESVIGGLTMMYSNEYVYMFKSSPWQSILQLLGRGGDLIMINLLLDCGIFRKADFGHGNYYQISGLPLWDLKMLDQPMPCDLKLKQPSLDPNLGKKPKEIVFVRSRFLYGRAMLNSRGLVKFGYRHIHALNRYRLPGPEGKKVQSVSDATAVLLAYIFPRQFGLHNVFTSPVNPRETVQPFKDYTTREEELGSRRRELNGKLKIPKRLRGAGSALVARLQLLHARCPYDALLKHYCPLVAPSTFPSSCSISEDSTMLRTQKTPLSLGTEVPSVPENQLIKQQRPNVIDYATPVATISAFCRAVLSHLLPTDFLGTGAVQQHNLEKLMQSIDRFLQLRRFEGMSLHDVSQGMKISEIAWLSHDNETSKGSQSDTRKRIEIFNEFLYYVFDSLLIPLLRCNFHVTESGVHRYRMFFFRHDVWRKLAEPAMAGIKAAMFEEIETRTAHQVLESRKIGFSQIRLLPKERGVRPITNLRRRPLMRNSKLLGSSINSLLAPVYNMLTFEKEQTPAKFGSTLFSVGDLYGKLKAFKHSLASSEDKLYICKVDVQSAFDTIPQTAVIKLTSDLARSNLYQISKHVEIKPATDEAPTVGLQTRSKPSRRWIAMADSKKPAPFNVRVGNRIAATRKNTVFVDNVKVQSFSRSDLLGLLAEHVQNNLVKIGKKYYRQKKGIPQGSVVSSLLCNYFYADLEAQHLDFLDPKSSLLLRLIDDFLLITTNPSHAKRFLQVMHDGVPEYGVTVSPAKTLVNFEVTINDRKLQRVVDGTSFPYCGAYINTRTLNLSKNRDGRDDATIADSLTVEYSKIPGLTFQRKVLNTFKIQCHAMFIDTSLNSPLTVARNVYEIFIESATKMYAYNKSLATRGPNARAGTALVIRTIESLIDLAFVLMMSKGSNPKNVGFRCQMSKGEVKWLCLKAFEKVLRRRQTGYGGVLEWVDRQLGEMEGKMSGVVRRAV